jgi:choline dehydrogenase-like flavoprotein
MAGLFLAQRLCRRGIRVVVVESGRMLPDSDGYSLNEICDCDGHYKWPVTGRVRALGGSSTVWGGKMVPVTRSDIAARPHIGAPPWPISHEDLLEGLPDVEAFFRLDPGSYEDDSLQHVRTRHELPRKDPDFAVRWAKWARHRRGNAWKILKEQLASLPNLEIWLDATVCDFTCDSPSKRLKTITCRNQSQATLTVAADHFALAAGTIESTRLLLMLDAKHEGRVFDGCTALGRYFQDHLDATVGHLMPVNRMSFNKFFGTRYSGLHRRSPQFELTHQAQVADKVSSAFAHFTANPAQNRTLSTVRQIVRTLEARNFRALPAALRNGAIDPRLLGEFLIWRSVHHVLFLPQDVDLNLRICVEQTPRWDNRINLATQRDRLGVPKAALHWAPSADDERTFRACMNRFGDFWRRGGFDDICRIAWSQPAVDQQRPIIEMAQDYAHPAGTTRMGMDRTESVVDADLVCHHVRNLSVVSASCFPSAGSANPSLTIMLLAWRAASAILRSLTRTSITPPAMVVRNITHA